ncbi:MAG TPA: GYD domain-containing protein [Candidatus Dormibacteraeota bacterium]|jgi:uncharacterized protein with GYD domain
MPTYIALLRYTEQGIKAIKESPKRREAAGNAIAKLGGKLVHTYMTLGRYDVVAIIEAPDDEAAAKFALMTGMQGNVSTETMRAFPEAEYDRLVSSLP